MTAVESPTAEEVAAEFVATKTALIDVIATALGGQDFTIQALEEWAWQSPVPLPTDDESTRQRDARVGEIEVEIVEAIGKHLLAQAERVRECRREWLERGGESDGR
jgi:hypothetical protein